VSSDNTFDLAEFVLPQGTVQTTTPAPKRVQKRREKFVQVPWLLIDALAPHTTDKAWLVLLHILYEVWQKKGEPIKLPNGMLKRYGVSRDAKQLALAKLERLGLISVERRSRKSPIITIQSPPTLST
jgi:hypothetical protein